MSGRTRIALSLRRLRVERELSQEALANDAEVDRSYVGRLERAVANPTVDLLDKLAEALRVDLLEFFRPRRSGCHFRNRCPVAGRRAPKEPGEVSTRQRA
jgi:transcriptional regulator with XRE-family HTH domain